jgi:predicted HD phosphohydrolase
VKEQTMPGTDGPTLHFGDLSELAARLSAMAAVPCEELGLSELDHALQCAAELKAAAPEDVGLQVAGLLHDVAYGPSYHRAHHRVGAEAVRDIFGDRVAQLVALHVDAKRYLVSTDPAYRARLSQVSAETFALQGGDMAVDEIAAYEAEAHWRDGLKLRRADDAAKIPGRTVPGLEAWLPILRDLARIRA